MDAIDEYLIKIEDFSKILTTLLKEKVVDKIIGAQLRVDKKSGNIDRFTVQPILAEKEEDVKDFPLTPLIAFGYARTDSASKFLHKSVTGAMNEKVGLIARPCDTRALIELAKIKQVNLDNLFIIGIEDRGMMPKAGREMRSNKDVDPTKIVKEKVGDKGLIVKMEDGSTKELNLTVAENCLRCYRKIPVIADLTVSDLGIPVDSDEIILKVYSDKGSEILDKSGIKKKALPDKIKKAHSDKYNEIIENAKEKRAKDLEEWEKLSQEDKIAELFKCTACGICIRGCPVCYCVDCILTKKKKDKNIDNVTYQLTRIAHDADRCIECGNCSNNCPQNLPLSLYFQSLNEAFKEKFDYEPGISLEDIPFRSGKAISQMELEKT
ncbi:MAG: Coenzyme F420 hydrogenase/dehydrogenase, beta subunit C-terminal domain [Candidatus Lokiarchaeota archaeon]|nr:Coenzyme F420 hydrogenase/dehydrogenase, beta subunit C-terminal domain [Candidatus Lokiarchaeota archaeon]